MISWLNPHAKPAGVCSEVWGDAPALCPAWEKGSEGFLWGFGCTQLQAGPGCTEMRLERGITSWGGAGQGRGALMKSLPSLRGNNPAKHWCSCCSHPWSQGLCQEPQKCESLPPEQFKQPRSVLPAPRSSPTLLLLFLSSLMPFLVHFCTFCIGLFCFFFFLGGRETDGETSACLDLLEDGDAVCRSHPVYLCPCHCSPVLCAGTAGTTAGTTPPRNPQSPLS